MRSAGLLVLLFTGGVWLLPAADAASKPPAGHAKGVLAGMDCDSCHTTGGWKMTAQGAGKGTGQGAGKSAKSAAGGFDHSRTGFPLSGEHSGAACLGCHVPDRAITRECAGCHADSHEGRLGGRCDSCHTSRGWADVEPTAAHRRTRFPLTGMHALLECTSCHLRNDGDFSSVPADCFACHEADYRSNDIHPAHETSFSRVCEDCHTTAAWTPAFLPSIFIGIQQAGPAARARHEAKFPIARGRHRDASCAECHSGASDGLARVDCTGCHEHSPFRLMATHRGMPGGGDGCVRCHPGGARR